MNETPADDAIVRKKSTPMPSSDAFVFFGATGDLAYKQIFPALQAMIRDPKPVPEETLVATK